MIKVIKPVDDLFEISGDTFTIFLGGSIEMGAAEKWQDKIILDLDELISNKEIYILNPRRDDWDSTWKQDPTEGTKFYEQVKWEMDAQEKSDLCLYYFAKDTMSPITLLELGHYSNTTETLVYVDPKYQRRGNVIMFCERYNIAYTENYQNFVVTVAARII